MASSFRFRAEKLRNVILEQARKIERRRGERRPQQENHVPVYGAACFWHILPVELALKIFSQCGLRDLLALQRVCRGFHDLITANEQVLARDYLLFQRNGTLPTTLDRRKAHSRKPEDLMILLSDLFPPPKNGDNTDLYSLGYLHRLEVRLQVCDKLSHYLATQVLDRFMEQNDYVKTMFKSRSTRRAAHEEARGLLHPKLTPLLIYVTFFLETYSRARSNLHDALYMDYDAGRLPVPIQPRDRSAIYHQLQKDILESPPFTNASTLLSTHHCMLFLVNHLRCNITHSSEKWISMMLVSSGLGRIVDLFAAETGDEGNRRQKRREFMQKMQMDWVANEREEESSKIFSRPQGDQDSSSFPPAVPEVWFEAATYQIRNRSLRHTPTDYIICWGTTILNLWCQYCMGENDGFGL